MRASTCDTVYGAQSHTPRNRCVRFVAGVAVGSRNTRFQAACWALPGSDFHRLIAPALLAISNRRLVALDDKGVTFKWKDYRLDGPERYKVMTLDTNEFIRRFLMHVSPQGFHRIRHYGLLNNAARARNIARIRELLAVPLIPIDAIKAATTNPEEPKAPEHACPCCGSRMRIIETFLPGQQPKQRSTPLPRPIRIDTS